MLFSSYLILFSALYGYCFGALIFFIYLLIIRGTKNGKQEKPAHQKDVQYLRQGFPRREESLQERLFRICQR